MSSSKVTPNSNERFVNGLLISQTDTTGKITYCNEEFIHVSGYSEEELLGQPHNIIRHPDMPRTIFKFVWSCLLAKKEANAYVKNLSKDGSFYWVFANISPSLQYGSNGEASISFFNSVRRKPNPKGLEIIKKLYAELLVQEKQGLDKGCNYFEEYFRKQEEDYENFILKIQGA